MKFLFIVLALCGMLHATAQELTDSIRVKFRELSEVVVTAKRATLVQDGVSIIPSDKERKTSTSGFSLLETMKIPLLRFDPSNKTITLQSGEDIEYFINWIRASKEEIANLRPVEVTKVEILRYPIDPRFSGAKGVVNFIIKKSESGGYVQANLAPSFLYEKGDYSLFAKFNQGNWNYLALAGIRYEKNDGDSIIQDQKLKFPGHDMISKRTSSFCTYKLQRQYYFALQAINNFRKNNSIKIKLGMRSNHNPRLDKQGKTDFNGSYWNYTSNNSNESTAPFINTDIYLKFANSSELNITTTVGGTFAKSSGIYLSSLGNIQNFIKEHAFSPNIRADYLYPLNEKNKVAVSLESELSIIDTKYSGSQISSQSLFEQTGTLEALWQHIFSSAWSTRISINMPVSFIKVNHSRSSHEINTGYAVQVNGRIAHSHNLSLRASTRVQPRISTSYNDLDRVDTPVEGTSGNVNLKQVKIFENSLWYMWFPSNNFQMSLLCNWEYRHNAAIIAYNYLYGIIFNRLINSGNLNQLSSRLSFTLKDNSGKLSFMPGLSFNHIHHNGIYPFNINNLTGSIMSSFLFNDKFAANIFFMTPSAKTYNKSFGGYSEFRHAFLKLGGSYSLENLSVDLAYMPLYKNSHTIQMQKGDGISITDNMWFASGGRRIDLTLIYTFNFGQKVSRSYLFIDDISKTSVR